MTTKTITIDLEAYQRLKSVQRERESFSETIKRTIPAPLDFEAYRRRLRGLSLSEKVAEAIEEQVRRRHRPPRRDR
ncbi:MAG: antitoxin VapB family protein [Planctomycetota bacterium]|jgi:predicted CopG family antitoxin